MRKAGVGRSGTGIRRDRYVALALSMQSVIVRGDIVVGRAVKLQGRRIVPALVWVVPLTSTVPTVAPVSRLHR